MTVSRSVQKLQTHASYELFTNGEVFFHVRYVIKSVFSYLRTLTTWHCPHSPAARRRFSNRSISPVRRAHSSKPAAAGLLLLAQQHKQTDRHKAIASTRASTASRRQKLRFTTFREKNSFVIIYKSLFTEKTVTTQKHTHTHPFNGPFSGTTRVSRYQKGKTNLDFTEARDNE